MDDGLQAAADPVTAIAVVTRHDYASRYVKRCERCRTVRGNSAFNGKPNRRSAVCRFCTERDTNRAKNLRRNVRSLAQLCITERRLSQQLERLRLRIRTLEFEAIAQEQENLFDG